MQTQDDNRWLQILQNRFRLKSFRKGQLDIIKSVSKKRDAVAVLPTGGGKSLCYQLPAEDLGGIVIVISPLIALMKDQVRGLTEIGFAAGALYSGQTMDEKREVFQQLKNKRPFILYLSPERAQNPGFAKWIVSQDVKLFAIDEAHCVSQWGHDFRPDYGKLKILRELKPEVPILALTATATPPVQDDIARQLGLRRPDRHVHGFYRPNLYYQVEQCADDEMKMALLEEAVRKTPAGRVLIYCGTRQQSETLSGYLQARFEQVGFYHAGLSANEREDVQTKLDRNELRILVATNAFGMGINYPDVRLVVHYQMPANIESFYQEMGRAGRDGKESLCLLLFAKKDKGLQSFFIQQSSAAQSVISNRWDSLGAFMQFIEGGECRHAGILTYFRDAERIESCGHCDACAPNSPLRVIAQAPSSSSLKVKTRVRKTARPLDKKSFILEDASAELRADHLRKWRKSYASEIDVPAFVVFSDRTLIDLANKNPKSLGEFAAVYGFGPTKTEVLGPRILRELDLI